ncbi:hypothetical protein, partial [Pseudomaricurvus hydrocarbonicus]
AVVVLFEVWHGGSPFPMPNFIKKHLFLGVFLQFQRFAKGQPKRSVGCPAEATFFVAGVYLSNLLCF